MPQPTQTQVHANVPLTNISIAYMQKTSDFVAGQVFPIVPVEKKSDSYYTYTKNDWFRDEAKERAPGTESAGSGYNLDHDSTYNCKTWAFHKDVPWDIRNNADIGINMDRDATEFVTQRLLIRRERLFADNYFKTGVWGKDYTGVATGEVAGISFRQWSDYANSDPINDIKNGRLYIKGITGLFPNTLLLGVEVFESLKQHPDILDRYKYTQAGVITADLIARVFEVDKIVVAGSVYATNSEGATEAYSFIHGKKALLCYSAPSPSLLAPSAGYIFSWKNLANNAQNGFGVAVDKFEMRELKADRVEGEIAIDPKLVAADCGVFFETAVI